MAYSGLPCERSASQSTSAGGGGSRDHRFGQLSEPGSVERRERQARHQAVLVELEQHLSRDLVCRQLLGPAGRDHEQCEPRRGAARSTAAPPTRRRRRSARRRGRRSAPRPARGCRSAARAPGADAAPVDHARASTHGPLRHEGTSWTGRRAARRRRRRPARRRGRRARARAPRSTARTRRLRRADDRGRTTPWPGRAGIAARARSRLLPTPVSPTSRTTRNSPAAARLSSSSSRASSSRRPMSWGPARVAGKARALSSAERGDSSGARSQAEGGDLARTQLEASRGCGLVEARP